MPHRAAAPSPAPRLALPARSTACLAFALCLASLLPVAAAEGKVDFARDIRPILSKKCLACHGPDEEHREAGLRLDEREPALAPLESGERAIVPGQAAKSELVRRIRAADPDERMPPPKTGLTLTDEQQTLLARWIDEGASYAPHWAYVKPSAPPRPAVRDAAWPKQGLDWFVLAGLERAGLAPSPPADKYALIRRASLDLRGLPPTPEEVAGFLADDSPQAYDKLVDGFLADSAYGERWARMWLDQARYADSRGYGSDPLRPNAWRYRDWVIDAFNRNLPFDQFTREQLAGDLLPSATVEQKVATAFHRNTMTNTEGGTDDEEFRVIAVKDRVDTTLQVWMGLTMGCAKCHNHKFEPLSQRDYYQFFAIFNQTADADRGDDSPNLPAPTPEHEAAVRALEVKLAALRERLNAPSAELAAQQQAWEDSLRLSAEWTPLQPAEAKSAAGAKLETLPDGSLLASGAAAEQETYTLTAETDVRKITALRLEALPDDRLPKKGPGRGADGNFVLSRIRVQASDAARPAGETAGRFVRIELPGQGRWLHLAEVQVFRGEENLARGGKATQSSTDYEGHPQLAIDGNTNGDYFKSKSVTHTRAEDNPWWEVDLGQLRPIDRIVLWNRTDGATDRRMAGYRVVVLDAERQPVFTREEPGYPNPSAEISPSGAAAVNFTQALADYSQDRFPVANALSQPNLAASGWAIGPRMGEPHWAAFVPAQPFGDWQRTRLAITLDHRFAGQPAALGRFRLSVTADGAAARRLAVPADVLSATDVPAADRSPAQRDKIAAHYRTLAPALKPLRDEIAALEKTRPPLPTVPVMQELADAQRRKTHVMIKGNFLNKGEPVEPALPASFRSAPAAAPVDRLAVAEWLVHPDNPLTARVAVNRFWAQLFGAGIVETEEDFGIQGELPSNQELLDWLAVHFQHELKWDMRALLKTIVTSATYQQSARVTPERLEKDPRNRLLSRAPRFRLEAEMVRDQALALSGLLSRKMKGPSVYPPQPAGLWQAAFNGERTWPTSTGEDRYRRGLYTFWRRTIPYPSMTTFDAPSRETCSIRRVRTNTPLQALVTLNDPVYVEAAQALARRIVREGGAKPAERAAFALRLCLVRPPSDAQVAALVQLYASELAHYRQDAAAAEKLAADPLGPLPAGLDAAEAAAWTVVANVLLNLDGVLMKG